MMDLKRYSDAKKFLWGLTRQAPESCREEIQEMESETYAAEIGLV